MTLGRIQEYLEVSERMAAYIVLLPEFPTPIVLPSRGNIRPHKRWDPDEVRGWAKSRQSDQPQTMKA